ncbi:MAG TPA: hypothetical protein PLL02_06760, partial [Bacteroidales bacterium]|nr:hypothetical protein [Bacteroidales bacterium]
MVFLPHFLPKRTLSQVEDKKLVFKKLAALSPENNKWIVLIVFLLTIIFFYFSRFTTFESDMNKINYMTEKQQLQMNKLNAMLNQNKHTIYCVAEGKTIQEALENYEQTSSTIDSLAVSDTIIFKHSGIGIYLPSKEMQVKRLALWEQFWKDKKENVLNDIHSLSEEMGFKANAFAAFDTLLGKKLVPQNTDYFQPLIAAFA